MKQLCWTIVLCLPLFGRAQSQLALDTSSTQGAIVITGTTASNGDHLLLLRTSAGMRLWRAEADGTPLWAREMEYLGTNQIHLFADNEGGVVMVRMLPHEVVINELDFQAMDSLRTYCQIARIAQDGGIAWQYVVSNAYGFATPEWQTYRIDAMAGVGTDGVFLVVHDRADFNPSQLSVVKLGMDGALLWARSFQLPQPPQHWVASELVGDNAGGFYIRGAWEWGEADVIGHVSSDGTLNWLKTVNYISGGMVGMQSVEAAVMADGSLLGVGRMLVPGHDYLATFRMDLQGSLVDAHFYTHPPVSWPTTFGSGQRTDGTVLISMDSLVVKVADDGSLLDAMVMNGHVEGDQRNTFHPVRMNVRPEGAVFTGVLSNVHVDLGLTRYWPAIRTIEPGSSACHVSAVDLEHVVVPTELYEVEEVGSFVEQPALVTMLESTLTSSVGGLLPTLGLCALMIPASLDDRAGAVPGDLLNTLASPGQPFLFATPAARRISVLDAAGRSVVAPRSFPEGTARLATDGWSPGLYLLRISDTDGSSPRSCRVVVAP